jgi:hypothetical protein
MYPQMREIDQVLEAFEKHALQGYSHINITLQQFCMKMTALKHIAFFSYQELVTQGRSIEYSAPRS